MSENTMKINELAKKIYNLDTKVYEASGSQLGRTFMGSEAKCIKNLNALLLENPSGHQMRSELALVSNMARTVPDKTVRKELLREYNEIMKSIKKLEGTTDIVDPELAGLNESIVSKKPGESERLIICINRTEGSAGTDIGFALADKLHINFYDSEVIGDVMGRQEREKDERFESVKVSLLAHPLMKNKTVRQLSRNHGLPQADADFFNASALLKELAKQEDFVIVGRCADKILQNNHIPHISVFITAPREMRVKRVMEVHKLKYKDALKRVARSDVKRERYYRIYTGRLWGASVNYDLCINSAHYGIDESVELIMRILGK